MSPDAHASLVAANPRRLSSSAISAETLGACPSGQANKRTAAVGADRQGREFAGTLPRRADRPGWSDGSAVTTSSLPPHPQRLRRPEREPGDARRLRVRVQPQPRQSIEHRAERRARLHLGEVVAEAEVPPEAEREVVV